MARARDDERWVTMERDERLWMAMRDHLQEKAEELDRLLQF